MARTAQDVKVPGAPTREPSRIPSSSLRPVLGWACVVVAVVATAVLAIVTLTANGEHAEVSRGSDQHLYNLAAEIEASSAVEGSDVHLYNLAAEIAEHGSIRTIEHRSCTG